MNKIAQSFSETAGLAGSKGVEYSHIRYSVLGTALAGLITKDQASFFGIDSDVVIDTSHALATVTPSVSRFSAAQTAQFLAFNPAQLANVNITGANAAGIVATLKLAFVRFEPDGTAVSREVQSTTFQTTGDYQTDRVQIPCEEVLDGYTFPRILTDAQVAAAQYAATFSFAPTVDRRQSIPISGPMQVSSPK